MGLKIKNSKNILVDGLVLNLDASDKLSYSGSGSVWTDRSSSGNNATKVGGTFGNDAGGSFENPQFSFVPYAPFGFTDLHEISFEAWLKVDSISTDNEPVMGRSPSHFRLLISNGQISFRVDYDGLILAGGNLQADTWTHVVATWNGSSTASIYKDGVFIDSENYPAVFGGSPNDPFEIGKIDSIAEQFFGSMAEVRVYNNTLTADEVLRNYNATKGRF